MALVRISRQLLSDVDDDICDLGKKVFQQTVAQLLPTKGNDDIVGTQFSTDVENFCWGDYVHLKDQMPIKWCGKAEYIAVNLRKSNSPCGSVRVFKQDKSNFKLPPGMNTWGGHSITMDIDTCAGVPFLKEYAAAYIGFSTAKDEHEKKFRLLRDQVRSFLMGSKSLNDAIKKYPDIKLYIPAGYIEDLERVVERTKKEKAAEEAAEQMAALDTNLITSMGVFKAITAST